MKISRLGLGVMSLAALLLSVTSADAWFFSSHCDPCHSRHLFCKHHCYETHICCRPYNAFTPICWGNLYCDGCCPNPCAVASGCCNMPGYGGGMPMFSGCGPSGDCGMQYGGMPFNGMPFGGMPFNGVPINGVPASLPGPMPTTPPVPTTVPPVNNHTAYYGQPMYYSIQPANYYPAYGYYPNAYYGNPYQAGYNPYLNWSYPNYGYGQRPY